MINPKKELFRWGPIDGRPIYVDPFVQAFVEFPRFFDGTWPDIFGYMKDDSVLFIADYPDLRDRGEHLFRKYILDDKKLRKNYKTWISITKKLTAVERTVNKGISGLSDEKLIKILSEWNKLYIDFWVYGFLPELSNWGAEQMLKREILKNYPDNFTEIFEKLSAPEDLSFFQKEEIEFFNIKLMKDKKKQDKKIAEHQKKYYWLRNNYGFTKILGVDYFREELDKISERYAENRINEMNEHMKQIKENKTRVVSKYSISKELVKIADRLAYCVWWQDYRKSFIFRANHIITVFLEEISRRKNIGFKELCYYITPEIEELVKNNRKINAKQRFDGFIEYYKEKGNNISLIQGKEANDFIKPYIEIKVDSSIKEFKGVVVSAGKKVTGKARIFTSLKNLEKMNKGDILVAPMTSPDYIIVMRKAAAIVTDEGNMTCHAAIVSRELKIPCIVGTKIATRVLKDGDMVEVDANKGIVKTINKGV